MDLLGEFKKFAEKTEHENQLMYPIGKNSHVLIIDGMNTYIRCFAATPTLNDDGDHVGGISGFLKSMAMVVQQLKPSRVVCVFDGAGGSQRRRKIFGDYKRKSKSIQRLNRTYEFLSPEQEDKSAKWQLEVLVQLLNCLPVTTLAVENVEADDVIAYLAELIKKQGGKSTILSTDKDFLQLVDDQCHVYNGVKHRIYTTESVLDEFGIHPNNFMIYRAIEGDKSDNINGIKGIGPKTMIKNFPSLANKEILTSQHLKELALKILEDNPKNAASKKLVENIELLDRNVTLMNLKDVDISGTTKIHIIDIFNGPINKLDKYHLTKLLTQCKLLHSIPNINEWTFTTWRVVSQFAEEHK